AIGAKDGKLRWETKVDDGGQTAGGMLVADGKVITGRTCPQGVRAFCFISAHDAKTGKELWKFYSTAAPGEPGGDTWANMPVEQRAPVRGVCPAPTIPNASSSIGVSPIRIPTRGSRVMAATTRCRLRLRRTSTATQRLR